MGKGPFSPFPRSLLLVKAQARGAFTMSIETPRLPPVSGSCELMVVVGWILVMVSVFTLTQTFPRLSLSSPCWISLRWKSNSFILT